MKIIPIRVALILLLFSTFNNASAATTIEELRSALGIAIWNSENKDEIELIDRNRTISCGDAITQFGIVDSLEKRGVALTFVKDNTHEYYNDSGVLCRLIHPKYIKDWNEFKNSKKQEVACGYLKGYLCTRYYYVVVDGELNNEEITELKKIFNENTMKKR